VAAPRAVLFDFAGTLFAPRDPAERVADAAEQLGVGLDDRDARDLAESYARAGLPGGPYPASIPGELESLYAERDLGPEQHRAAYVALLSTVPGPSDGFAEALYQQALRPEGWVPYLDTLAVLRALWRARVRVGLISNVGFDLRAILVGHGVRPLAERATLSFEHGLTKPDPALFALALTCVGATAAQTLMVGDHPVADGSAANMGIRTLLLPMSPAGSVHGLAHVLDLVRGERDSVLRPVDDLRGT
jgi:FMN phosphatase YigB (HAD superfamily)